MTIKAFSVAVSSYILFKELRGFSSRDSAGLALSASVLTLLLEKIQPKPKETNHWFECKKEKFGSDEKFREKMNQLDFISKMIKIQQIAGIAYLVYINFYGFAQKNVISRISENQLKMIPMAILIAPIVEEILFRGFLKEWIEVGCDLIDRHIYAISKESQHHISNIAQAILFGAGHMINENKAHNAVLFALLGIMGVIQGLWKRYEEGSLLTPIKMHIIQNTVFIVITTCLIPIVKQVRGRVQ